MPASAPALVSKVVPCSFSPFHNAHVGQLGFIFHPTSLDTLASAAAGAATIRFHLNATIYRMPAPGGFGGPGMTPPRPPWTAFPAVRPHPRDLRLVLALGTSPDFSLSYLFIYLFLFGGATKSGASQSLRSRAGAHSAGTGKGALPGETPALPGAQLPAPRLLFPGPTYGPGAPGLQAQGRAQLGDPRPPAMRPTEAASLHRRPCPKRFGAFASLTTKSVQNLRIRGPAWVEPAGAEGWGRPFGGLPRQAEQAPAAPGGGPWWGPRGLRAPDIPGRCRARPPFCRMCLRPLFRF